MTSVIKNDALLNQTVIFNDSEFLNALKNVKNNAKMFCVVDTSKKIKLLSALNVTYVYVILSDENHVWNVHPEFLAFNTGAIFTGQLVLTDDDYSVLYTHKASLT